MLSALAALPTDGGVTTAAISKEDAAGANAFAIRLLGQAAKTKPDVALSPWSVRTALGLVGLGAAGTTWDEVRKVTGLDRDPAVAAARLAAGVSGLSALEAVSGQTATGLFVGQEVRPLPAYVALASRVGAAVEAIDFKTGEPARAHINAWADAATGHRIKEVLPPGAVTPLTRLVIANALVMNARWATPFLGDQTFGRPFHEPGGKTTIVPMMFRKTEWVWKHQAAVDAVVLPYKDGRMELVLVVPTALDGLAPVEAALERGGLDPFLSGAAPTELSLYVPAFAQEASWELTDSLKALGLRTAFSGDADLSGIDGTRSLQLGAVHHRVAIELDETGTRAAAVTAAMVMLKGLSMEVPAVLVVDRPFLYFVREKPSGAIVFEGRVVHPTSKHAPVPAATEAVKSEPAHEMALPFGPAHGY